MKRRMRMIGAGLLAAAMFTAAFLGWHFTPREYLANVRPAVNLEAMLPQQFGDWELDGSITPLVVDPSQLELIDRIYSQTVSRTYRNAQGHRVMLTMAYGRDQSESLQLHTPEFCYPAVGYAVTPSRYETIPLSFKPAHPVVKLVATRHERIEPITYWVTMGDYVTNGGPRDRRNVRFKYGFEGFIPDGVLVRISTIGSDVDAEYALQREFIDGLFTAMRPEARNRLAGTLVY